MNLVLDDYDTEEFASEVFRYPAGRLGYVVTPNADHLIRLHENQAFRDCYARAEYVLLDSRLIATLIKSTSGRVLRVCPGADLTAALLGASANRNIRILLIGGTTEQALLLARKYGLADLRHHEPPMGFIADAAAVETCLSFIEANSPFDVCLLAVGSPQQELTAYQLKLRDRARGLVLCVGASVNFLTGVETRAPKMLQSLSLEWAFRLMQSPRRMFRRYVVRGPKMLACLKRTEFIVRKKTPRT